MKYSRLIFTIILALPVLAQAQKNLAAGKSQLLDKPSLCFVENKGQIKDQYGQPRKDIDFKLESKGVSLFVSKAELSYQFYQSNTPTKTQQTNAPRTPNSQFQIPKKQTIHTNRIDVVLEGANEDAEMVAEEPQQYYENYILWNLHAVAHSYNKITYKNIYPHIDWVLYIKDNKPEYDFIIHEGGDVNDIKIRYKGTDQLALRKDGSLDAICKMGKITELQPYAYEKQTGKTVATNFKLKKHSLSFEVGEHEGELVLDPSLIWGTYYGESDAARGIFCDHSGNVYFSATTNNKTSIATAGSHSSSYSGGEYDAMLVKFNSLGVRQWATYYGGDSLDLMNAIGGDDIGNVYITGYTCSDTGIATAGSFKAYYSGNQDAFLAKFDPTGALLWGTYYGSVNSLNGSAIACDIYNNVYMAGGIINDVTGVGDTENVTTTGAYQTAYGGDDDAFLVKFNAAGVRQWGTYFGGRNIDWAQALVCDDTGNIYIAGHTESTNGIATANAWMDTPVNYYASFIAKFNGSGNIQWSTYYWGGITAICMDHTNNLYIAGTDNDTLGLGTYGAYQYKGAGINDAFIAKFTAGGRRLWGTYYGGANQDFGNSITTDNTGCVYIGGNTSSPSGIASAGSYDTSYSGGTDMFFAKFTPRGQRLWGTYYGGTGGDGGGYISCDPNNNLYLSGGTNSTIGISTASSFQPALLGSNDALLAKFNSDTTVIIDQTFNDSFFCKGVVFNLNYLVNYAFRAGNVFSAELSDAAGSFASPVIIGSVTASGSGYISCSIPSTISSGTAYRIRIIASLPGSISPDNDFDILINNAIPILTITSDGPVCLSDTLKLVVSCGVPGINYTWTGPSGFASLLQDPVITPFTALNAGKYHVTASAPGCASKYDSTTVTVKSSITPAASIGATPSSVVSLGTLVNFTAYVANCGASPTYQWYKNGVAIPGANTNPFYTDSVVNGDVITVVVKSSDPCTVPDTVVGRLRLSIGQNSLPDNIQLYPNPFTDGITLTNAANSAVMITDVFGRQVYQTTIAKNESFIDLSNLSPGVYFLQLQTGGIVSTQKIVKK